VYVYVYVYVFAYVHVYVYLHDCMYERCAERGALLWGGWL